MKDIWNIHKDNCGEGWSQFTIAGPDAEMLEPHDIDVTVVTNTGPTAPLLPTPATTVLVEDLISKLADYATPMTLDTRADAWRTVKALVRRVEHLEAANRSLNNTLSTMFETKPATRKLEWREKDPYELHATGFNNDRYMIYKGDLSCMLIVNTSPRKNYESVKAAKKAAEKREKKLRKGST